VGVVHRSGEPALVDDSSSDPVLHGRHSAAAAEITEQLGPGLMVPLGSSEPLGMVVALRAKGRPGFDRDVLEPVTAFAAQTALALTLARSQARERRLQVQADRDRIARDLHDHVVQRIFATALSLDRLGRSLEGERSEAAERVCAAVDELDGTIAEIRAAIFELHQDDGLGPDGLRRAVADLVRGATEGRSLRRDVRVRGPVEDLPPDLVSDVLAVVRELTTNVVRHARASRLTVTLTVDDHVRVVVTDDGRGLPPGGERSGLANLADRAERRGGRLVTPRRAVGTQVRWSVPRP
jgi:signal transduction histidine kinase